MNEKPKLYMSFENEQFLRDESSHIVSKTNFLELVDRVVEFYSSHDDEQINNLNNELDRLQREEYEINLNRLKETKNEKIIGFVYFVKNEENKIKIGCTTNLNSRLKSLNTSSPHIIELVAFIESSSWTKLEEITHEYFFEKHIKGEWFEITKDEMITFAKNLELDIKFYIESGE